MNTKKIKNYFDMRENLILNKQYEDEDELSFEEARNTDEQRAIEKRIADSTTAGFSSRLAGRPAARSTSMGLMTELQKNNLSFDAARRSVCATMRSITSGRSASERSKCGTSCLRSKPYFKKIRIRFHNSMILIKRLRT